MSGQPPGDASPDLLRVIGGPAAGMEFPLTADEVEVGRGHKAGVAIPDKLLSRVHFRLRRDEGGWLVEDLGSTNGTAVGGERVVGRARVPYRVPVRAGKTVLELLPPPGASHHDMDESCIAFRLQLPQVGAMTRTIELQGPPPGAEDRKLATIYRLQGLLSSDLDETSLHHAVLEAITDAVPADHAYLLLRDTDKDTLAAVSQRDAHGLVPEMSENNLSRSIVNYAKDRGEAVLSRDAQLDERFRGQSVAEMQVRSVMCVPMPGRAAIQGLIYLVRTQAGRAYAQDDLRFLAAIAYSGGLAIENRRLLAHSLRQERMAAIGLAAASLSHCVKNILTGLEGSVSLIRLGIDGNDTALMNAAWDILNKNHKRLSSLMLDLLNLAREESPHFDTQNLTELVLEAVETLQMQAQKEHIRLEAVDVDRSKPIHVECDGRGLHRVLMNLLHNALDATRARFGEQDGGQVQVHVGLDDQLQTFVLSVSDNGAGIKPEDRPRIFEIFHTTKGSEGTGLGLAVTRKIVETHRGAVTFASEVGKGTTFTVRAPIRHRRHTTTEFWKNTPLK